MSSVPVKRDARQTRPPAGVRLSRVRSSFSVYCARAPLGSSDLLSRLRNAMRDGVSFKNLSFRQPWAMGHANFTCAGAGPCANAPQIGTCTCAPAPGAS